MDRVSRNRVPDIGRGDAPPAKPCLSGQEARQAVVPAPDDEPEDADPSVRDRSGLVATCLALAGVLTLTLAAALSLSG